MKPHFTRRAFLKLSAFGLSGLALRPWQRVCPIPQEPGETPFRQVSLFPEEEHLGRVTVAGLPLMSRPTPGSQPIRLLYEDEIIVILRRLIGYQPSHYSQIWIETPEGYLWSPAVQPVWNQPNDPVRTLPETSLRPGMWAEVSVPFVELVLDNPPARAPWLNNYGEPTSRGCVNASPDDAKWAFRWTMPHVPYDPGDVTVGLPGGTSVKVVEI